MNMSAKITVIDRPTVRSQVMYDSIIHLLGMGADAPLSDAVLMLNFARIVAYTVEADGLPEGVAEAMTYARSAKSREEMRLAFDAFIDAIDNYPALFDHWALMVDRALKPLGDESLAPPHSENADTRKKT